MMEGMRIIARTGTVAVVALLVAGCGGTPGASVGAASTPGPAATSSSTAGSAPPSIGPTPSGPPSPPSQTPPLASFDGWIVYQRSVHPTGGTGLWLIRPDGSGERPIVTDVPDPDPSGQDEYVAADWARDGSTLLFQRHRLPEDRNDLFTHDVASGISRELVHCDDPCADATEAAMAPDGSRIVYFFAEGALDADGIPADCGLRLVDVATATTTDVTNSPCGLIEERFPRWSPDGRRIAFLRTHEAVKGGPWVSTELVVRDLASGRENTIVDPGLDANTLDWSPDGTTLAFIAGRQLRLVAPDGGQERVLVDLDSVDVGFDTRLDRLAAPRFAPDSASILFGIYQDDGAGTAVRRDTWVAPLDGAPPIEAFPGGTSGNPRGFYTRASLVGEP